ncbi:MAG: aminotransferase class I/II-fold pyridoxal phosphate-dependent enzyme, partial [Gammaproteobacteria bacterium]|nr:aminotransferase class I/II-fold pyridoxal phosphate-dependent enzyme [Gammaproteobacteria bacterium]
MSYQAVHLADRMSEIQPFYVMDILARARQLEAQGRSIVHLEIGEPDFASPETIIAAGQQALSEKRTQYTPATGIAELKQKISDFYQSRFNTHVPARRIVITPGASGALHLALAVLLNPGDRVLMADPGYPCNRHFVRLLEAEAATIAVSADSAYQLTADSIQQHWTKQTVAALVASPSNPTGTLIEKSGMLDLIATVERNQGCLLVDEIYQGLVYSGDEYTTLSLTDNAFVINSFSKFFGMTGWRLGWMVVPDAYLDAVDRLAQNIFLAPPTLSQYAALAAFGDSTMSILEHRRLEYQKRRDFFLPRLRKLGFDIPVDPQGAFYIYADASGFTDDSYAFVYQLLESAGVAATPG